MGGFGINTPLYVRLRSARRHPGTALTPRSSRDLLVLGAAALLKRRRNDEGLSATPWRRRTDQTGKYGGGRDFVEGAIVVQEIHPRTATERRAAALPEDPKRRAKKVRGKF